MIWQRYGTLKMEKSFTNSQVWFHFSNQSQEYKHQFFRLPKLLFQNWTGHKDSVTAIHFNFDGKLVATSSYDGTIKVYETWSGKLLQTLEGPGDGIDVKPFHQRQIWMLIYWSGFFFFKQKWFVWHDRGNVILAGSRDGSCWLWNAQTAACKNIYIYFFFSQTKLTPRVLIVTKRKRYERFCRSRRCSSLWILHIRRQTSKKNSSLAFCFLHF